MEFLTQHVSLTLPARVTFCKSNDNDFIESRYLNTSRPRGIRISEKVIVLHRNYIIVKAILFGLPVLLLIIGCLDK